MNSIAVQLFIAKIFCTGKIIAIYKKKARNPTLLSKSDYIILQWLFRSGLGKSRPGICAVKKLNNPFFYILFFGISACIVAVVILSGFMPKQAVFEVRGPISRKLVDLRQEDMPTPIEGREFGGRQWAIRRPVEDSEIILKVIRAAEIVQDALYYASAQTLFGSAALAPEAGGMIPNLAWDMNEVSANDLSPLLALDGASAPQLYGALPGRNNDVLDNDGHPLRWRLPNSLLAGYTAIPSRKQVANTKNERENDFPNLKNYSMPRSPAQYRELVERFAKRYNLSVELVYAIIHSESDFSPTLVSNKSAMGLMQILPGTASGEVHRFLYGRRGQVSYDELRVPEINIRYGTAYLHILFNRYFQKVTDPVSREYCAIAAYNLGPNRFLRLYGPTNDAAVEKLNSFTSEALYKDLIARLPARETRYYIAKVKKMKNYYTALLGGEDSVSTP